MVRLQCCLIRKYFPVESHCAGSPTLLIMQLESIIEMAEALLHLGLLLFVTGFPPILDLRQELAKCFNVSFCPAMNNTPALP